MTKTDAPLDERIAAALAGTPSSADLAALLDEARSADRAAEAAHVGASRRALDPATGGADLVEARKLVDEAKFTRERLAVAIERLEGHRHEAQHSEEQAQRDSRIQDATKRRDAMVAELRERYPALVNDLVDLLRRLSTVDAEARSHGLATAEDSARHGSIAANQMTTPLAFCRLVDFERRFDAFIWADGKAQGRTVSALAADAPSQAPVAQKWIDVPTLRVEVENPTRGQPMLFVNASNAHVRVAPGQRVPSVIIKADLAKVRENFTVDVLGDGEPMKRAA